MFVKNGLGIAEIANGNKTVGNTAAALFASASALKERYAMAVTNKGTLPIYYGNASVTTSNGMEIGANETVVFEFLPHVPCPIYFIASTPQAVCVAEVRA